MDIRLQWTWSGALRWSGRIQDCRDSQRGSGDLEWLCLDWLWPLAGEQGQVLGWGQAGADTGAGAEAEAGVQAGAGEKAAAGTGAGA